MKIQICLPLPAEEMEISREQLALAGSWALMIQCLSLPMAALEIQRHSKWDVCVMVFTLLFVLREILSKIFTFSLLFHRLTTEHSKWCLENLFWSGGLEMQFWLFCGVLLYWGVPHDMQKVQETQGTPAVYIRSWEWALLLCVENNCAKL